MRLSLSVVFLAVVLAGCGGDTADVFGAVSQPLSSSPKLVPLGQYQTGFAAAEIVSVQAKSGRAALSISDLGVVDVLSLAAPDHPILLARHHLGLAPGEELTSVSFHPKADWFAAAIRAATPGLKGRLELRSATSGALLRSVEVGVDPDCVAFGRDGEVIVVANEGERFTFDPQTRSFESAPGSLTVVNVRKGATKATAKQVALDDASTVAGFTSSADGRWLERSVDWNGNGRIDSKVDFDANGVIENKTVQVGTLDGVVVTQKETSGEVFLLPLLSAHPKFLEPELVTFSKSGDTAYVTLQENNGVVALDVEDLRIKRYLGLSVVSHLADTQDNGTVAFVDSLTALPEPDGIGWFKQGGVPMLVTADEGDTDPKASKTLPGLPTGGSRTVSVLDARTGRLLGSTGAQLDEAAAAVGAYPDDRSDSKGTEPENLVVFELDAVWYAAVGLERADAVALVSLQTPSAPQVLDVARISATEAPGTHSPEGVAWFKDARTKRVFVLTANETSGSMTVFEVTQP